MSPEAEALLERAREHLDHARQILAAEIASVAAREAYMAAFHAAQAVIFERTGKAPKTHSGVHSTFGRLAASDAGLGRELGRFLPRAYELKDTADYRVGGIVTFGEAEAAIEEAGRFVAAVEAVLRS